MRRILNHIHYNSWFVLPLILFSIFNFGNYSFLMYTWNGKPANTALNSLKYIRIIFAIIPIIILFGSNQELIRTFFGHLLKNFDILLLILIVVVRMGIDFDVIYPLWFLFSILSFFLVFLIFRILSKNQFQYVQKVVIFVFICSLITVPFTFFSIPKLFSGPDIYFSSKTSYTYFNLITILATLSYFVLTHQKLKIKHFIFIALNILVILLSGRRTPLITSFIAILIYTVFYSKSIKINLLVFILFFTLYNNSFLSENFFSIRRLNEINFEEEGYDDSYRTRLELRGHYIYLIQQSKLLGIGFEKYEISNKTMFSTHNTYLTSFLVLGVLGGILYILILLRSLFIILSTYNSKIIVTYLILFIPLFTINWVESNFLPGQIFFIYTISVLISPRFILWKSK